jgi:hypothetical protein
MVQEALSAAQLPVSLYRVTITCGSAVTEVEPMKWRVAKKELVSILRRLLGTERLNVEPTLPDALVLKCELDNFKVKITEAKNETYESWRERDHDDLVLAVALACWKAEQEIDWSKVGAVGERGLLASMGFRPPPSVAELMRNGGPFGDADVGDVDDREEFLQDD